MHHQHEFKLNSLRHVEPMHANMPKSKTTSVMAFYLHRRWIEITGSADLFCRAGSGYKRGPRWAVVMQTIRRSAVSKRSDTATTSRHWQQSYELRSEWPHLHIAALAQMAFCRLVETPNSTAAVDVVINDASGHARCTSARWAVARGNPACDCDVIFTSYLRGNGRKSDPGLALTCGQTGRVATPDDNASASRNISQPVGLEF